MAREESRRYLLNPPARVLLACLAVLCLVGCDPTIFKKPAQDFATELRTLRDGYFTLLKVRREAQYERASSQQKQAYWLQPKLAEDPSEVQKDLAELDRARKRGQLPPDDLLVRQRAFDVLDAYAGTILALASNDATESITAELTGLSGDLKALAEVAKSVGVLKDVGEAAESWFPTISGAIGAVQKIMEVVSNVIRANAIRDVVHAAHDPVKKLLEVLEGEAGTARRDALRAYGSALDGVEKTMKEKIAPADVRNAMEYRMALKNAHDGLTSAPQLSAAFKEAGALQDKLYKSVTHPDTKELAKQAQLFRKQVRDAKAALDAIP